MLQTIPIPQEKYWISGLPPEYQDPRFLPDSNPFLAVFRRPGGQTAFRKAALPQVVADHLGAKDTYLSQCFFRRPNRQAANLFLADHCWVDLDTYRSALADQQPESASWQLLEYCDNNMIPLPTSVFSSGRGLYAKWSFSQPVPAAALPRLKLLNKFLADKLADWGADKKAVDCSRVLRLPGSINSKNGQPCRLLWPLNRPAVAYVFSDLCDEVFPFSQADWHEKRAQKAANSNQRPARPVSWAANWNWPVFRDLCRLASIRGWDLTGVPEGHRDLFAFLSACQLAKCLPAADLPARIEELLAPLIGDPAWSNKHLLEYCSTAIDKARDAAAGKKIEFAGRQVDPRYRHKKQTIIELLSITEAEQRELARLISAEEKTRRRQAKQAGKAAGKAAYRAEAVRRYEETGDLPPGKSPATIRRWRADIRNQERRKP